MEVIVAAISAAIALAALVVSIVIARRQTIIQERLAAIEEARHAEEIKARGQARVTVSLYRGLERLTLRNEGPALARGVDLEVEKGQIPPVLGIGRLPVDLQPGQQMTFEVPGQSYWAPLVRVKVRWTDEAGDHKEPFTLETHF